MMKVTSLVGWIRQDRIFQVLTAELGKKMTKPLGKHNDTNKDKKKSILFSGNRGEL